MRDRQYTPEQIDAAVATISDPERLRRAEQVVTHAAPGLQRIIDDALQDGGWFSQGHEAQVASAAGEEDVMRRTARLHALLADEARLAMLVGVTVGIELAHELDEPTPPGDPAAGDPPTARG